MDLLDRMNSAMDYIESELCGEISYSRVAQIACCSTYYFQRMFAYITGIPLSEYIRKRRITLAAMELMGHSDVKVIDIAFKYGYDSPEAFTRAFKLLQGVSPTEIRRGDMPIVAYSKITFSFSLKGGTAMKYKIETRPAFKVFGKSGKISIDLEQAFKDVPYFCRQCDEDGTVDRINATLGHFDDSYLMAALYDFDDISFKYMLCGFLPKDMTVPKEFTVLSVPETEWAIFPCADMDMQGLRRRIYTEWFPVSGYEQIEMQSISFEMYYGIASHDLAIGEIWIPVRKVK